MKPLCVDCDGTLIKTDLLHESVVRVVLRRPWLLGSIFAWLLKGRPHLKAKLAEITTPAPELLPYSEEILALIQHRRESGGRVLLVTASTERYAEKVARHCACFDEVIASDAVTNLKGNEKKRMLVDRFGPKGFDYAGDSSADLPVWEEASEAIVVGGNSVLFKRAQSVNPKARCLGESPRPFSSWLKLLRVHQWAKNLIIFVPLLTSHRIFELPLLAQATTAFFSFSFLASATYIFNDLCDLDNDRAHATKRRRPLAAGSIGLPSGVAAAVALGISAVALGYQLGFGFLMVLTVYLCVSVLYSSVLKKVALVDVLVLSGLYIWRLVAGGVATGIVLSNWLLSFALFVFTSLALAKRYVELSSAPAAVSGETKAAKGRGYFTSDLPLVLSMGVASALVSVLVVLLYVNSPEVILLYRYPQMLFLLAPLVLFWIGRVWLLASRNELHEDPVLFAIRDRFSYGIAIVIAVVIAAATGLAL